VSGEKTPWLCKNRRVSRQLSLDNLALAYLSRRRRVSTLIRRGSVENGGISAWTPRFFVEPARIRPKRDGSRDIGADTEKSACLAESQDGFRAFQLGSRHTAVSPEKLVRSKVRQKDSSLSAAVSADDATVFREPRRSPRI
jgi:hypothetical protein